MVTRIFNTATLTVGALYLAMCSVAVTLIRTAVTILLACWALWAGISAGACARQSQRVGCPRLPDRGTSSVGCHKSVMGRYIPPPDQTLPR